jgi:thiol-disulfide isomerase/thioredoxin
MTKRALGVWLAVSLAMVGCKVQHDAAPERSASSAPPARALGGDRVRIWAAPASGGIADAVRDALGRSAGGRRRLVVYVGAKWCEPCRRVHEAIERGELDARLSHLDLLEYDLDRDRERLAAAGYASQYIPLFALPSPEGTASGKQIEGAIKGEGAVTFIVPRLEGLLAQ